MDISASLNRVLSKFTSHQFFEDSYDDAIINYLEESFKHTSDEDLDFTDMIAVCEAYIPSLPHLPREEFISWYMKTRSEFRSNQQLTSETDGDTVLPSNPIQACVDYTKPPKTSTEENRQQKKGKKLSNSISEQDANQGPAEEELDKLTEDERQLLFERYGFVQSSNRPVPIPDPKTKTPEPKSQVRYLDGKVVDTKGKKYVEIKQEYPNMPQPVFLKALRRYKFH